MRKMLGQWFSCQGFQSSLGDESQHEERLGDEHQEEWMADWAECDSILSGRPKIDREPMFYFL